MTDEILTKWKAGFVRRWHSNPDLCGTIDPTDGHSARVVKLALMLQPDLSRDAIIYAISHDDGECGLGDVSGLWKRNNPELAKQLQVSEAENRATLGINLPDISEHELRIVDAADKIDAYLWMMHHNPKLAETEDWKTAKDMVYQMIFRLADHEIIPTRRGYWLLLEMFS